MPKLTEQEVEQMLARRRNHLHLATIGADGGPSVVPIGFTHRDGVIYMTARAKNKWLADIRRNPQVCASIDDFDYFRRKIIVRGPATIVHGPGEDDSWRDLRLPLPREDWPGPTTLPDGSIQWRWDEAYTCMTHDEPRALVGLALATATVETWRMPGVGEYLDEAWSSRYFHGEPRRFKVSQLGESPDDWKVVEEARA